MSDVTIDESDPRATRARDVVADVYRSESRRVLATLIRLLGDFDLAEEALHDAFASAIEQWLRDGVPANPRAWLVSAGRFKAIDAMRMRSRFDASLTEIANRQNVAVGANAENGGPHYQLTGAFSLSIDCESQAEVDELWEKQSEGGSKGRCAWLKDRFGLSWQVVPSLLPKLMSDPDPARAGRVMQAMMQMTKIDLAVLQRAYDGE